MENYLGIAGLLLVAFITFCFALRNPCLRLILTVAFLARAGAVLFHFYVAPLPDSGADAVKFERRAWEWAQAGVFAPWTIYLNFDSYMISRVIGTLYALTDRSMLMAQSLSAGFGTGCVYLVAKIVDLIWGHAQAAKAAWVTALFPTLVLYSALTMRETYIWFFFLFGLLGVVHWAGGRYKKGIVLAMSGLGMATLFHGAMFVALLAFLVLLCFSAVKTVVLRLYAGYLRPAAAVVAMTTVIALGSYASGMYSVPKLGTVDQLQNSNRLLSQFESYNQGSASYPDWLVPESFPEMLLLMPVRATYFLYSPFPWNVKTLQHVIGLIDSLLYMFLSYYFWKNRKAIWSNRQSRMVFFVVLPVVFIFAVAIGNFGTAIRHRAKFAAVFIILATPVIPKITAVRSALLLGVKERKRH